MRTHLIGNHGIPQIASPTSGSSNLPTVQAIPIAMHDPHQAIAMHVDSAGLNPNATIFSSSLSGDLIAADLVTAATDQPSTPTSHAAIYGRPDEAEWLEAEIRDIKAKMKNKAFEIVRKADVPAGKKIVKSKFAYKTKFDPITNELNERRARYVACGYSQAPGDDFNETTCGTMRGTSVRALFLTACMDDMDIYLGDVVKAFTQAELDKDIYVEIPPQFNMPDQCFKALKSLEGLKQSGHLFQREAYSQLRKMGFKVSEIDPNVWYRGEGDERTIIGLWVDDAIILTKRGRRDLADKCWSEFRKRFNCEDLKVPSKFVGLEISRDRPRRKLTLRQTRYIDTMFDKYMAGEHCKQWSMPVGGDEESIKKFMEIKGAADATEAKLVLSKGYMSLIGSLLYAAAMTRPDIAFHVAYLAKHMASPSHEALAAAQGVLCYLKRTRDILTRHGLCRPSACTKRLAPEHI